MVSVVLTTVFYPASGQRALYYLTIAGGVAHLGEGALFVAPIFGEMVTVDLTEAETVRECRWFNGTLLLCKRGFWFEIPGRKRLGVALPKSVADRWREMLVADRQHRAKSDTN